ncbi:hypothetical protein PSJ59_24130 [Escherichia coli]|uniref:hypothetical protein n=1 Tax=Escherichia coli TaxID=562 RepID=UPI002358EE5F|nr:hypothetical protein [Escherichia coli]MDC9184873.1 hypothetical protein [Escherichia coli]
MESPHVRRALPVWESPMFAGRCRCGITMPGAAGVESPMFAGRCRCPRLPGAAGVGTTHVRRALPV